MLYYNCQGAVAQESRGVHTSVSRGSKPLEYALSVETKPKATARGHAVNRRKKFAKPLDKLHIMWYNRIVKRRGREERNRREVGSLTG